MNKKFSLIILLLGLAMIFGPFVYGRLELGGILTMEVLDGTTGAGIEGCNVYIFEGGGSLEHPDNAVAVEITDNNGYALFSLGGFYRVGIVKSGYTSERAAVINPGMITEVSYAYWGACGVGQDHTYTVELWLESEYPGNGEDGDDIEEPFNYGPAVQYCGVFLAMVGGVSYVKESIVKPKTGKRKRKRK